MNNHLLFSFRLHRSGLWLQNYSSFLAKSVVLRDISYYERPFYVKLHGPQNHNKNDYHKNNSTESCTASKMAPQTTGL